jgi:hypothetical protein
LPYWSTRLVPRWCHGHAAPSGRSGTPCCTCWCFVGFLGKLFDRCMKLAVGEVGEGGPTSVEWRKDWIRAPRQGCTCACMSGFRGRGEGPTRTSAARGRHRWHHVSSEETWGVTHCPGLPGLQEITISSL